MRQQDEKTETKMTPVSALAMCVEAGLSRRQYEIIRSTHKHIYIYIYIYIYISFLQSSKKCKTRLLPR